jgi:hypothetical protein
MGHPSNFVSAITEGVKINSVHRESRHGRMFWIKRRKASARPIMTGANYFFRLAKAPVRAIVEPAAWQRWEVACFSALHGADGFEAFPDGANGVGAEEMPGTNLTDFLDGGTMTPEMAAAAGRELRRAHQWHSPELDARWSHGDPHAGNFVYHEATDRARIIDFEVMHDPTLCEDERQADDVLVFLQDMVGRIGADKWLPCAEAFLLAYDRPEIIERLQRLLAIPPVGLSRLWWRVRTTFMPIGAIRERFSALKALPVMSGALAPVG